MNQQNSQSAKILRLALTLTGLALVLAGMIFWFVAPDSPDSNKLIITAALVLAGFVDLFLSWFVFRGRE